MSSIIIAGCGYVGERLADQLHQKGEDILGLTHSQKSTEALSSSKPYAIARCDISDPQQIRNLPMQQPDFVVHCAASGRGGGVDQYRAVYAGGCRNLTNAFPEATVIYTSSTSVYGQIDGSTVTETSETEPSRETGRILLEAETTILNANGMVARLAGIYGPGRSFILKKFFEKTATLEEDGSKWINQVHVTDIVNAVEFLMMSGKAGNVYNVCDSQPLTQKECYQWLADRFEQELPPSAPRNLNSKRGWSQKRVSNEKLVQKGWTPRYPSFLEAVEQNSELVPSIQNAL